MQRRTRRVPVNTRLDIETKRELVRIAEAEGRTLSDVARRMIEKGMADGLCTDSHGQAAGVGSAGNPGGDIHS